MSDRDVAIVLSGGGMNAMLLELGFLKRLRESSLWSRIGWIYGTSAGALAGTMAALDRLDELEDMALGLQPHDIFRPQRLWRLPLNGLHEYALPETIAERLLDPLDLAHSLSAAPIEVVVFATDVSEGEEGAYELAYSSREVPPETMARAVLASAAVTALVLPLPVGDRIATDGGWVRNFPLGSALDRPEVELVVAFRYIPLYPHLGVEALARLRRRLHRFRAVPPVRAFIAELDEAEARERRGEPIHLGDMMIRLMRVAIQHNTARDERLADEREAAIRELASLRADLVKIAAEHARPGRRGRAARAVEERFARTALPRSVKRITVRGSGGAESLEQSIRGTPEWTERAKRGLIERGYAAADAELRAYGVDAVERAS
ncbi:MAG TPA: patatin-like phospholipase family protein [Gaiellaceae bacterium]|nr:patatin-like phospholipase family protein [Gaiellaceae bacterium]